MDLESTKTIATIVSAVVLPVLIAFLGNNYTQAIKEREIQAQFVKIATDILQAQPTPENANVREWATEVINRYSGVPLSAKAQEDLIRNVPMSAMAVGMKLTGRLPRDEIIQTQNDLRELGYYEGESTGTVDEATVKAIIEFQKEKGEFPDGALGPRTKASIRESFEKMSDK